MGRRVWLLVLLAACGKKDAPAPSSAKAEPPRPGAESPAPRPAARERSPLPEVALPAVSGGGAEACPDDALVVTLTGSGRVLVEDREVTLDGLGAALWEAARDRPWKDLPTGVRVSLVPVVVRADEAAPWQHAQWVLTICAEQKIWRTYFAVRTPFDPAGPTRGIGRALNAHLPTDKGIARWAKPPEETFVVETTIRSVDHEQREWPGAPGSTVNVPTALRYGFGEDRTQVLAELSVWIREEIEAAKADGIAARRVSGLVSAGTTVPTGKVVEVLSLYVVSGYPRTDFKGSDISPTMLRKAEALPYPTTYVPR